MADDRDRLIREIFEALAAGDRQAFAAVVSPDIVVSRPFPDLGIAGTESDVGIYRGIDAVLEGMDRILGHGGSIGIEAKQIEPVGSDRALVRFVAGSTPGSGEAVWLGWAVVGFRDGLISSSETYATEAEARGAIDRSQASGGAG